MLAALTAHLHGEARHIARRFVVTQHLTVEDDEEVSGDTSSTEL